MYMCVYMYVNAIRENAPILVSANVGPARAVKLGDRHADGRLEHAHVLGRERQRDLERSLGPQPQALVLLQQQAERRDGALGDVSVLVHHARQLAALLCTTQSNAVVATIHRRSQVLGGSNHQE